MHHRRSALAALCVVVALVAAACAGVATAPQVADSGAAASGASSSAGTVSAGSVSAGSGAPPNASEGDDGPRWELSPQWALHPELLQGSKRFQELTRKGRATPGEQPNVVLITTDDMNANEIRWMPKTRALLGGAGASFSDSVSPHPLCCPARAMTLTGQYAQNNGVRSNFWPSGGYYKLESENTLPVWLDEAGYQTAFMGKYLNEYGLLDPLEVPPGWDDFRAPVKSGIYDYYNYTMNENGELEEYSGTYQTDYYAEESAELIGEMAADEQPFFLWQSHLAPHSACPTGNSDQECWDAPTPSMAYDRMFDDVTPPQQGKPSYNEQDVSDKPELVASRPRMGEEAKNHATELFQRRIESLQSVDDAVARTVAALDEAGELDDTLIIFTSDNGYLLGEHRYRGKILGYEPALQVPLLMRGPSVPAGVQRSETVGTLDLAPTIAAATGATPGLTVDGRNLLPVAAGRAPGWDTLLIQGGPRLPNSGDEWLYRGVRTDRYTYMEYPRTGEVELYDRLRDPYQLENAAGEAAYAEAEAELRGRLLRLQDCAGADCRQRFGPVPAPDTGVRAR